MITQREITSKLFRNWYYKKRDLVRLGKVNCNKHRRRALIKRDTQKEIKEYGGGPAE